MLSRVGALRDLVLLFIEYIGLVLRFRGLGRMVPLGEIAKS